MSAFSPWNAVVRAGGDALWQCICCWLMPGVICPSQTVTACGGEQSSSQAVWGSGVETQRGKLGRAPFRLTPTEGLQPLGAVPSVPPGSAAPCSEAEGKENG